VAYRVAAVALSGLLVAAGATGADLEAYPKFEGAQLDQGRSLWLENCEGCHGYGIAGAPVPMKPADWRPRLAKGKAVLYEHAINGFFGPEDTMMPERGGNPELSDTQVRAAVDYMTALAVYYIHQER
jgi:cytochrome c5